MPGIFSKAQPRKHQPIKTNFSIAALQTKASPSQTHVGDASYRSLESLCKRAATSNSITMGMVKRDSSAVTKAKPLQDTALITPTGRRAYTKVRPIIGPPLDLGPRSKGPSKASSSQKELSLVPLSPAKYGEGPATTTSDGDYRTTSPTLQ